MPTNRRAECVVVASAAAASAWYVVDHVVARQFEARIPFADAILAGTAEPPYRFRVLWPHLAQPLERLVALAIDSRHWQHVAAYGLLTIAVLALTFVLFHDLLRRMFAPATALVGTLLLALAVPLATTGFWAEDDFLTLLAYVVAFQLMARGRDAWMPLVVGVAAGNREQAIFLVVLHALHAASRGELRTRAVTIAASAAAWAAVFLGLRAALGDAPSRFTAATTLAENLAPYHLLRTTLPLWLAQTGGVAALAVATWRRSDRFFRWALVALIPYVLLFAAFGLLWETAKFLPAYLVLVPMALQALAGETARLRP